MTSVVNGADVADAVERRLQDVAGVKWPQVVSFSDPNRALTETRPMGRFGQFAKPSVTDRNLRQADIAKVKGDLSRREPFVAGRKALSAGPPGEAEVLPPSPARRDSKPKVAYTYRR